MRKSTLALLVLMACSPRAYAQAVVKVSDDVNFKFGVLGQFQADALYNDDTDNTATNLFIRRARLILGGQVAKNVTFFFETDAPNLGKTLNGDKNITPSMIVQDAYAEFRHSDAFALDAGLMFVPFSRNSLQAAGTLLALDYGSYTYTQSAATESSTGRDTGFQAKGYVLENRLEYRLGTFQGFRNEASNNSLRVTGRVQYNVFDTETAFFYTGTYLGAKKILAFGGAFDTQSDFHAYAGDVFFDYPAGPGAVTAQVDFTHFDGGETLTSLKKQDDVLAELGYFIKSLNLSPVLQFTRRNIAGETDGDETRTSLGANYWFARHNANLKAAYTHISPRGAGTQHGFTVQLQMFYF